MSDRWKRIAALFDEALEHPPSERNSWLENACGEDESLYQTVQRLVHAHERTGGILDTSLVAASEDERGASGSLDGETLGPYRLIREIGHGGMGVVHLAERADNAFDHSVAIKVVRRIVSRDVARRFEFERQILATLDHPNIATLHGGGTTPDGRPYLVMEYVDGTPLTTYCDDNKLSIDERLDLFITVADAVQAAHRALVVHRDLKPSNILVNGEGRVKLLDFGIAKWLDPSISGGPHDPPTTRPGARPMTLAYASPEQLQGEAITTASDVYQLGLILYELLAGRRAYDLNGRSLSDMERVVCEELPSRPSTAVTRMEQDKSSTGDDADEVARSRNVDPDRLQRKLRGDLDAIVMTALLKEPDRRYSSVSEFADDLRRYREKRPVHARGDSAGYRARRFIHRHRWESATAAVFLLVIVAYALTVTIQSKRVQDALTDARTEAEKSAQVTSFLMDLFEANDPSISPGEAVTARELLSRGVERAESLDDQPVVRAEMFDVIGRVYFKLAEYDRSELLLRRSLEKRRALLGPRHPDVATSLNDLAETLEAQGRLDTAEVLYREALSIREQHLGQSHPQVAASLNNLGELLGDQANYAEARPLLEESLALRQNLLGPDDPEVAVSLSNLGMLHWSQGRYDRAERFVSEALEIRREALGPVHAEIVWDLNSLGLILDDAGRLEEAEELLREALSMSRRLYGDVHPEVATTMSNLSGVVGRLGREEEERKLTEQAFEMRERMFGPSHPQVAIGMNNLAAVYLKTGRAVDAEETYRAAVRRFKDAFGEDHPHVAYPLLGLARTLLRLDKDGPEAVRLARDALALRDASLSADHWLIAETKNVLGASLARIGQHTEAASLLEEGYMHLRSVDGRDQETRWALEQLVAVKTKQNQPTVAEAYADTLALFAAD
ncbi:hypothetical protein CRI94_10725 [Longibacter salinarum]|uniref:Protein kinase domain-containing protein n=1 Tax=Longibacter salinarum TaxID=1850348 RepID=A0A2A8CWV0_9BACT|nr:serine/threonine-protein kinase [Longibacter salinarum]PEN13116.1 hypothetical protein CRI94_10725 [Longibacter salinarum]